MFRRFLAALAAVLVMCAAPATAENYKLDFKASNFIWASEGIPSNPVNSIAGSFSFRYDSFGAEGLVMSAVDLVVDGHTYTLPEISAYATRSLFAFSSIEQLNPGTNAFQMFYTGGFVSFGFTSDDREGLWSAGTVDTTFAVLPAAVPEPQIYWLLLSGFGLIGYSVRRRRPDASVNSIDVAWNLGRQ